MLCDVIGNFLFKVIRNPGSESWTFAELVCKKLRVPVYTAVFQSTSGLYLELAVSLLSECQISFELGKAEAIAMES